MLAANIQALHPDLVALQEVSLYRRQTPSDFTAGAPPNATEVVLDFLATFFSAATALLCTATPQSESAKPTD